MLSLKISSVCRFPHTQNHLRSDQSDRHLRSAGAVYDVGRRVLQTRLQAPVAQRRKWGRKNADESCRVCSSFVILETGTFWQKYSFRFSENATCCSKPLADRLWSHLLSCTIRILWDKNRPQYCIEWVRNFFFLNLFFIFKCMGNFVCFSISINTPFRSDDLNLYFITDVYD